ncbi:MAG: response regulator [Pseudomonadota bacterium]|nr:response regulator [Pseudomonadota bacterium]
MSVAAPRILLVEDDPDDVLFMRRAFAQLNVSAPLDVVEDGARAIAWLEGPTPAEPARADTTHVLLDLKLPLVPGIEVLRWLRSRPDRADVRVIVLTSSNDARDIDAATALGIDAFLVKPIAFGDLLTCVRAVASTWGLPIGEPAG